MVGFVNCGRWFKLEGEIIMLSHVDNYGKASMVDIGAKNVVRRTASAFAKVVMLPHTVQMIKDNTVQKGDVLAVAKLAGIMAAKKVDELIPLCHSLNLEQIMLDLLLVADGVEIISYAKLSGKTGVEMEALTAVSVAALTVYDMCKAVDKSMRIENVHLRFKQKSKNFTIASLNVSAQKGTVKTPVEEIVLRENYGIEGDAHAGAEGRQVSLLAAEDIEQQKIEVSYGMFAENITTYGVDLAALPVGTLLYLGETVLEVTQIGKACHAKCEVFAKVGDCIMPRRGIFAKVIKGGKINHESDCYYYI